LPRQPGFWSVEDRLRELSAQGDPLEKLLEIVDFELFRPVLDEAFGGTDGAKGGRPPFDAVLKLKMLYLQAQHGLSFEATERLVRDRLSWMRFCGLSIADPVPDAPTEPVLALGLQPGEYLSLVARPIPENSILEIVAGFSTKPRGKKLVLLGNYDHQDPYHAQVLAAASSEVLFPGAIYDKAGVQALRFHSLAYAHGHTVGGTNPSLVEAMAASNPVIAHDNPYNRWVAQDAALYFKDAAGFSLRMDELLASPELQAAMSRASALRFQQEFTWDHVAGQYEKLLLDFLPARRSVPSIKVEE